MIREAIGRAILEATRLRRLRRGPLREGWSLEMEAWSRVMHHYARRSHHLPLAWQRKAIEALVPATGPRGVTRTTVAVGERTAEWIVPDEHDAERAMLYLHGGGYSIGSIASHRHFAAKLAREAGMRALVLDYRLAPEHPFPAGLDDARAAWRWLLDRGLDPARMGIAGESAGAGLTLATLVASRDAGEPLPGAAALLSPWVDLTMVGASLDTNDRYDFIPRVALAIYADRYAGKTSPADPLVSPLFADLAGLPPLLIQAGEAETLLDDARRLHERATAAGGQASLTVYPDMIHAFMLMRGLPAAPAAIAEVGEHFRRHLA